MRISANVAANRVPGLSRLLLLLLFCLIWCFASGCSILQTTAHKKSRAGFDAVQLQQQLMRFADDFSARMRTGIDNLRLGTNKLERTETLQLRLNAANGTLAVVTGPNPGANLLDMVALVSLTRSTIEDYWIPYVYGDSARPLLASIQQAETEIWHIAGTVLKPEQSAELRKTIVAWRKEHPDIQSELHTRHLGFMARMVGSVSGLLQKITGAVGMLILDPLSGLDPATREVSQSRLTAERALYMARCMPLILREESELLALHLAEIPEIKQMLTNSTQISASVERASRTAEELLTRISSERKAILGALEDQQGKLAGLVGETQEALKAGEKMSTSLNSTLSTFDSVLKRLGVGEPKRENLEKTNSPPFNVLDYAKTANEVADAARQLDTLFRSFNGTIESSAWNQRLAELKGLSDHAQTEATSVLKCAFLLGAGLIAFAFGAALLFKFAAARVSRRAPTSGP